jgi:hypothetical protein
VADIKVGLSAKEGRTLAGLWAVTALTYAIGLAIGARWLLPVLNAAPAYGLMIGRLRAGERAAAVRAMLTWAAALAVCGTVAFACWPHDPGATIVHGPEYREEMFHWIRTGEGAEGTPRLFLAQHVQHLAAFVVLCLLTASAVSILMGAVLMNYMAYYVASLARAGTPVGAVLLFGWQPWAIVRVAAFCILGAVLAEPLLARLGRRPYAGWAAARPYLVAAAMGIAADWILKAALAPTWGLRLRGLLP